MIESTLNSSAVEADYLKLAETSMLLSEVITGLSYALDLTEGQPAGHSIRCCWIGMHIGQSLGFSQQQQWDLYYTLLLKDAGCSSNAARLYELYGGNEQTVKHDFKFVDNDSLKQVAKFVLTHTGVGESLTTKIKRLLNLSVHGEAIANELIETRCERGADIAKRLGFNEEIANGIRYLDEHWNGRGHPYRLAGHDIPMTSQIALLAQVADVFFMLGGKSASLNEIATRSGSWFDPELVSIFSGLSDSYDFWHKLGQPALQAEIQALEPASLAVTVTEQRLDDITAAFSLIVDAKSPFTHDHSSRVALYTDTIAQHFDLSDAHRKYLQRGALLHDIGKLGVSNDVLDKPGKLTESEWQQVRKHPQYSEEILSHLTPFEHLAKMAGAHHERLDGKGYPYGLKDEQISLDTRIITVADIFDALTAERPYRPAMPLEKALNIMDGECGTAIDETVFHALKEKLPTVL